MRTRLNFLFATALLLSSITTHAGLIGVSNNLSSAGQAAAIIAAPADIGDDASINQAMQGFDEQQNVVTSERLRMDQGWLARGSHVNSHMIFLNSAGNNRLTHLGVKWVFDGIILGVMSDKWGRREAASNDELGAIGTIYPGSFRARGLEQRGNPDNRDGYRFDGNELVVGMRVSEPGDWIRVITAVAVPEPGTIGLLVVGLLGLVIARRQRRA